MRALPFLLAVSVLAAGTAAAGGKVYRWTDSQNRVHYGDLPPADAARTLEVNIKTGGTREPIQPLIEGDSDSVAKRKVQCDTKRQQLTEYQNAVKLVERDSLGREKEYSAEDRQKLIAQTQTEIGQVCDDLATPEG